ncbi:MAG: hypothetical protein ABI321_04415 [Polyangia bacterium]
MNKLVAGAGLAALLLPVGCASRSAFNAADNSGGDCTNTPGEACSWANAKGAAGYGIGDGNPLVDTPLYFPADLTFASDGRAYVSDWNNHRVRRVEKDGIFTTFIGTDYEGDGPPNPSDEMPYKTAPGCNPQIVALNHPTDVRFAADGTFILAAWHDNKIRVVDPTKGLDKVLAGGTYGFAGDGGPAANALMNLPKSIVLDDAGRIYLIDQRNERLRMIDIDADRTITTIAGNGTESYSGDGGPAVDATVGWEYNENDTPNPSGALAIQGHKLYFSDGTNQRIRVIDLDTKQISCLAGPSGCTFTVALHSPLDLEWGPDGRLFMAERDANIIDALDITTGVLTTVVGTGQCSGRTCIESGTHHQALDIQLNQPWGIAFDALNNLYVADTGNHRIVRVASEWTK